MQQEPLGLQLIVQREHPGVAVGATGVEDGATGAAVGATGVEVGATGAVVGYPCLLEDLFVSLRPCSLKVLWKKRLIGRPSSQRVYRSRSLT